MSINLLWFVIGVISYLKIVEIIEKHFGKCLPGVYTNTEYLFILLGGVTTALAILMWLTWEWNI